MTYNFIQLTIPSVQCPPWCCYTFNYILLEIIGSKLVSWHSPRLCISTMFLVLLFSLTLWHGFFSGTVVIIGWKGLNFIMRRGRYIIFGHLFSTGSFFMSEGKVFLLSILVWAIHDLLLIEFLKLSHICDWVTKTSGHSLIMLRIRLKGRQSIQILSLGFKENVRIQPECVLQMISSTRYDKKTNIVSAISIGQRDQKDLWTRYTILLFMF